MGKTVRLGLFIVTTLAVLVVGIFLIGQRRSLFRMTYQVKTQFANVAGLTDGADVRVGGLHEGSVKHIQLPNSPDGKVTVVMDLQNDTRNILNRDSIASIRAEGLIGDKYVEISFGSANAPKLKDGDTIGSEAPFDVSNLAKKASDLLDNAKDTLQNLDSTADNMKSISAKVNNGQGTVGALINDKSVYQKVTAGATALDEDMEALKHNFLLRGFFKKRGYEDAGDLTKHQISNLPAGTPTKTFDYDGKEIFDKPNTAKLRDKKALNAAGEYLQSDKFGLAVVVASVGMKGETDKDRTLTEARASAVRDFLAQNFRLDDTRIKTIGLGKTAGTGDTGKVEILVYPPGAAK